ncbi:MAG: hypothetical protein OMM_05360 [Candidatus Magnetoglobus multicellularis str. Araruama]|uniref:TPR repeat-containing protein n=1 Tax=Candidatus Magnetoglobus multicellularis str. Araruama TaxID=890399 RepID=A0A1V1NX03_9BACT|nr:MAG: hypothetical protein OMM_05360 [Candidatus Magnetoglobus multicellularis str. Araruama]
MSQSNRRKELLGHAARCFRNAGMDQDACRCLKAAHRFSESALIYQNMNQWLFAAQCFEQVNKWESAAYCYLNNHQPMDAARCLIAANESLEAGWIMAHLVKNYKKAREILIPLKPDHLEDRLCRDLALGRCMSDRKKTDAGRSIRNVILHLNDLSPGPGRHRVMKWSFILAMDVLDRPDLISALFNAAKAANIPDIQQKWDTWTETRLKYIKGIIPKEEDIS